MKVPLNSEKVSITSNYGNREYYYQGKLVKDFHSGIDLIPRPCNNNEILAFADGVVTGVQKTGVQYGTGCYVRLKHDNGFYTLYYHLKSNSIVVNKGDKVKKGQKLGIIGTTGISTGVHLHFQIDKGTSNTSINPYDYLFNGKEFIKEETNSLDKYSDEELAKMVIRGDFGNGQARKDALGNRYSKVQSIVNDMIYGKKEDIIYVVKRGDNLSKIAKKYGTTWQKIYNDNKNVIGNNPNLIYPNQKLVIKL